MDGERETQRNRAGVQTWDEMGGGVADDAGCILPALVSASNDADPKATKVNVSVQDFPGLLRIVAWVLNGLELRVERATLSRVLEKAQRVDKVRNMRSDFLWPAI